MNKIFRVIWNHATQSWVAVSELTKAKGKTQSKTEKKISVLAISLMTAGATVIGGSALAATATNTSETTTDKGTPAEVTVGAALPNSEHIQIGKGATVKDFGKGPNFHGIIAIGLNATATESNSVAVGRGTFANASSLAFGPQSQAYDNPSRNGSSRPSVAIGYRAYSSGGNSVALGTITCATAVNSIAIGSSSHANANRSVVLGAFAGSITEADNGHVIDGLRGPTLKLTTGNGEDSVSIGTYANAILGSSIALGRQAKAIDGLAGSVAIGANSHTRDFHQGKEAQNVTFKTASGDTVTKEFEGKFVAATGTRYDQLGTTVLSVGNEGMERQIHHVAAGRIANDSTDAINGSQLYNVLNYMGFNVHNNADTSVARINNDHHIQFKDGELTKVNVTAKNAGADASISVDVKKGNINNTTDTGSITAPTEDGVATVTDVVNAINSGFWNIGDDAASAKAAVNKVRFGDRVDFVGAGAATVTVEKKDDNKTVVTVNTPEYTAGTNIQLTKDSDGKIKISSTSPAVEDTNTQASVESASDSPISVTSTEQNANGTTKYVVGVQTSSLTVPTTGDNKGKVETPTNGSNLVNATEVANAINSAFHTVNSTKTEDQIESAADDTGAAVKAGDTVTFTAAKNLEIKQDGRNITYGLSSDIEVNNVTANNVKVGDTTITNGAISNLTNNLPNTNNNDEYKDGDEITKSQDLPSGLNTTNAATVGDILNSGWNLQNNGEAKDFVKPYDTVNFVDGMATTAVVETDADGKVSNVKYNVKAADDTITVSNDGVKVNTGESKVENGKAVPNSEEDANKIATVGDIVNTINGVYHTVNTTKTEDQITSDANATGAQVKAGDTVTFGAGKNLEIKQDGHNITYGLSENIEVNNITANNVNVGPVTINKDGIDAGNTTISNLKHNLPNTNNNDEYKDGDEITKSQDLPSGLNTSNAATVGDILNSGWNLQNNGEAKDFVKPYDTVNFVDGTATTAVVETDADGKVSNVKYNVKVDNSTIKVDENGNLVADSNNIVHGDNVTTTVNNGTVSVNTGNSTVTDGRANATTTDADGNPVDNSNKVATVGDIVNTINSVYHTVNSTNSDEQVEEANGTTTVKAGDTLNFVAGKNLVVNQADKEIKFGLSQNIEVQTVTVTGEPGKDGQPGKDATVVVGQKGEAGKDGVDGSIGVNGKDGSAVVINGKDGSIGLNGKDGKDGLTFKSADGPQGVDGQDGENGLPGESGKTRIVYQPTNPDGTPNGEPEQVATLNDGLIFTGNNEELNRHKLNTVVKVLGEGVDKAASEKFESAAGNINVEANGSDTLEVQLNKDLNLTSNGSVTIGDTVINNGKISGLNDHLSGPTNATSNVSNATETAPVNLSDDEKKQAATVGDILNAGWNLQANGQAVDAVTHGNKVNFTSDDGSVTITPTTDGTLSKLDLKVNATNVVNQVTGNVAGNTTTGKAEVVDKDGNPIANPTEADKNKVATVGDVADTINNTGWTTKAKDADGNDTNVIVNPGDQVNYTDGKGSIANITVTTDPVTGKDTVNVSYDVKAGDNTITVDNDGVKVNTGKITPAGDEDVKDADGNVISPAGKVTVADGEGDKVATVQNVADAINSAGWIVNTGKAADQSSFTTEEGKAQKIGAGDKVNFQAGKNLEVKREGENIIYTTSKDMEVQTIVVTGEPGKDGQPGKEATVVVGQKGQPGKDGVDGSIGVNGKDGSAVVINGKDGSIGLNGKDGANGLTIKGEQGPTGVDGKAGESKTRIVYQPTNPDGTPKGEPEQVATLNDGLRFAGNDNVEKAHKLNTVVRVKGEGVDEATSKAFKSASGNINVRADNNGTLEVQLAKDLKGINSISNGQSSVTLNENGGTTIKGGDVNVSGNKITNVKAGTDPTDAVNVSQLRSNITNVNNRINKVSKEARGGIAGANAAASLPQVYLPGKSMVAASAGTFKGQNALAVGYSRASDNGKLILKLQGNANSQGDVGAGVGIGYQW